MKRKLRKLTVLIVVVGTGLTVAVAKADLVAYWKLDETSGTIVNDSSGHGYHGTVVGGTPVWNPYGKYGGCLDFDGKYGVSIPPEVFSNISKTITVSVWVNCRADQPKETNVILQAGTGVEPDHHFIVSIYVNWHDGTVEFGAGHDNDNTETWEGAKLTDCAGNWNHYTFISDTVSSVQSIYHNGQLVTQGTVAATMSGVTVANIGMATDRAQAHDLIFDRLDDIRIYDRALSADEITGLYRADWPWDESAAELAQVEALINRDPKEAIPHIERKIAESKQRQEQPSANEVRPSGKQLFHLQFLLAKAKKAAGSATKDVDEAYRLALEQGVPSLSSYASVLLWLFETGQTQECERIVRSLLQNNQDYLKEAARKAESMVAEGKAGAAVKFLERNLATYKQWHQEHPNADVAAQPSLPMIYFQLAKAKETGGAPKKDIAYAYCQVFVPSPFDWVAERAVALQWLLKNECTTDYTHIIRSSMKDGDIKDSFSLVAGYVCRDFEAERDWAGFEHFLDALLAEETYPFDWVKLVESSIDDNHEWVKMLLDYCDSKPKLKFVKDCRLANEHVDDGEFKKAAQLYQDIFDRCPPEDDRSLLEFEIYRCTFLACEYPQALSRLETFIADNKTTKTNLVRQARLMIARCYMQLGQIDTALQELNTLTIEYPQTEQIPQARFLVGYCHMLQGKPKEATEVFEGVVQDYPESSWANKARLCLARLRNMADEGTAKQD